MPNSLYFIKALKDTKDLIVVKNVMTFYSRVRGCIIYGVETYESTDLVNTRSLFGC